MGLTVYPTITFNNSTGSDANSGSGGSVVNGTAATVTNSSTSVSITDAVNLAGVATDGSAVLYVVTASGRRHTRISAIAGSSGAWTLTVQDSTWAAGSGLTWSIGGAKSTLDSTASRTLAADFSSGWTIAITDGQTQTLTSTWTIANLSNISTALNIFISGTKTGTAPVIVQSANAAAFNVNNGQSLPFLFSHLTITNSNATKTSAIGIQEGNGASVTLQDVVLGDASATNNLGTGISVSAGRMSLLSVTITNCTIDGLNSTAGSPDIDLRDVQIDHCGSNGINVSGGAPTLHVDNAVIYANSGRGVYLSIGANTQNFALTDSTVDGNTSHGVDLAGVTTFARLVIAGNCITGNGGYGVNSTASGGLDNAKDFIDYNTFGSGSSTDGPANTSGAYNGITAGSHDQVGVSPGYTNRASFNFQPTSTGGAKAKGFPASTKAIGQGGGATNTAKDAGAAQHTDAGGGGGGLLLNSGMTGGFRG